MLSHWKPFQDFKLMFAGSRHAEHLTLRSQRIELAGYLANEAAPVPLVLDLRIAHDRFGSSSDP